VEHGVYVVGEQVHVQDVHGVTGVIDVSGRQLRGAHNLENIMAATLVGVACGLPLPFIERVVTAYKGLEHRLEYVGTFDEVAFYNDSISTTPESAIAALDAFSEPPVLILGGSEKFADFSDLAAHIAVRSNLRGVILIGQTASRIRAELDAAGVGSQFILEGAMNMTEVFGQVATCAQPGDVVLLSPACASFGMFKNYADRGQQFVQRALEFRRSR
ncbi:MAG: UDP-N-acetylmuramoyl-L-alanine--D-glutamate ligase, partial [Candidatus Doudnabacteria bacterium]|nr:UDP-N-acetylmuramoyl-L-alanine--D-glutamate ligase [Candidatus Doudnabacteria bacterium]